MVAVGGVHTLPAPQLAELRKVITHTRQVGVVLPPPDIRAIIDKTAQFVTKNGMEFEKRILASEKNNVKFNFLLATDPYHGYYKMRIKDFADEGQDGSGAKDQGPASAAAMALSMASLAAPVLAPPPSVKPLEKPADEAFTVHVPEGLSYLDLDIVKLTAQFVARNGKSFLVGLSSREHSNPQFNFLKPTHSMFTFFTSLCDAYSRVMMPEKSLKEKLAKDASDSSLLLERSLRRLEWEKAREREAREVEDEKERERLVMQAIDWHDFTICETIEFEEGEDEELPPPLTLKDIIALNKAKDYADEVAAAAEAAAEAEAASGGAKSQAPASGMDAEERAMVQEAAEVEEAASRAAAEAAAAPLLPPPTVPAPRSGPSAAPDTGPEEEETPVEVEGAGDDVAMDESDEEDADAPVRVVKNYVRADPRAAANRPYDPTQMMVSPITGELIAIAEMGEHMRISLIDPKWREQREAMVAKIRDSTAAGDDEITRNLVGLARTRPDIFGSTQQEVTNAVTVSIQEKAMSGAGRSVVWDGATSGGQELRAQVRAIAGSRQEMSSRDHAPPLPHAPPAMMGPRPMGGQGPMGQNRPFQQQQTPMPPPVRMPPPPMRMSNNNNNMNNNNNHNMNNNNNSNASQQQQQQQQQQPPLPPPPMMGGGPGSGIGGGSSGPGFGSGSGQLRLPPPPNMNVGLGAAGMLPMGGGMVRPPLTLAQQQAMQMAAQQGRGGPMGGPGGGMGMGAAGMGGQGMGMGAQGMGLPGMGGMQRPGQAGMGMGMGGQGMGGGTGGVGGGMMGQQQQQQQRPPLPGGGGGGGGGALPPPPREAPPPMPEDEPESKRARTDLVLEAEEDFLSRFPGASSVKVVVPEVEGSDKLIGQMLEVEVASLKDSVADFKQRLAGVLDLAANKQNLSRDGIGFLRNELSLAHYNVSPDIVLVLGVRERGGRKK
ncbi:MAG: hypothetical protein WDW36_010009 [Sanguina aurantia]